MTSGIWPMPAFSMLSEIAGLVPDMRTDDVHCGLFGPSDGFVDGHLYRGLLAELATEHGIRVLQRNERLVGADVNSQASMLRREQTATGSRATTRLTLPVLGRSRRQATRLRRSTRYHSATKRPSFTSDATSGSYALGSWTTRPTAVTSACTSGMSEPDS